MITKKDRLFFRVVLVTLWIFWIFQGTVVADYAPVEIKGIPHMGQRTGYYLPEEVGNTTPLSQWDHYVSVLGDGSGSIAEGVVADCGIASLAMVEGYFKGYESNSVLLYHYTLAAVNPGVDFQTIKCDPALNLGLSNDYEAFVHGYICTDIINYEAIYESLKDNKPVLIHSKYGTSEHWAVVYKYQGSTGDTIDRTKFWVLSPYVPINSTAKNQYGAVKEESFETYRQGRNVDILIYRKSNKPEEGLTTVPLNNEEEIPDDAFYSMTAWPPVLDFGVVYAGSIEYSVPISRRLTVQNIGNRAITLDTAIAKELFSFGFSKKILNPWEQAEVWVSPLANPALGVHSTRVSISTTGEQLINVEIDLELTAKDAPAIPDDTQCIFCEGEHVTVNHTYYQLYEGDWTDNGDGTHSGMAVMCAWMYCEDCGDGFDIELTEPALHVGRHEYEDGYCWDCESYAVKCEHAYEDYEWIDSEAIFDDRAVYLDEGFHLRPYTSILHYACTICGEEYIESYPMEGEEAHHYDENGLCACGAMGEPTNCDHLNWEERDFEYNVRYSDITATEHTKTADLYSGRWCLDCETYRSRILWESDAMTIERHVFEDGGCSCGYTGGCVEHLYVNGLCVSCGAYCLEGMESIYWLPTGTTQVLDEAFLCVPVQAVVISEGCSEIGMRAFAQCADLKRIVLPESIQMIADDAFNGCTGLAILAPEGSYAQRYAEEQGITWHGFE